MKKFAFYIKDFHTNYYDKGLYITFGIFISILIFFNYYFSFENTVIRSFHNPFAQIGLFILENILLYFIAVYILKKFRKKKFQLTKQYIKYVLIALVIISIDRSISIFTNNIRSIVSRETFATTFYIIANATSFFTMFIPLLLFKRKFDKEQTYGLYGLRFSGVSFTMYFYLLFIVVPLVFIASFIPEFIHFYPTYKRLHADMAATYWYIPEQIILYVYETIYIGDFLFTELAFRGLLIIGISKFIGKDSILPMVTIYAALHFGKPVGETISSVFGGYILGILALYSKNIWGGVFLHGGVALSMEIFGFMQQ